MRGFIGLVAVSMVVWLSGVDTANAHGVRGAVVEREVIRNRPIRANVEVRREVVRHEPIRVERFVQRDRFQPVRRDNFVLRERAYPVYRDNFILREQVYSAPIVTYRAPIVVEQLETVPQCETQQYRLHIESQGGCSSLLFR